ncbi:MAG TPA: ABC transporter permease, partial [Gemmataceae bacterium]|nr:ABC transporter permease [Gemmataceae bacterium]
MLSVFEQFGRFTWFALAAIPAGLLAWRTPAELLRQLYHILLGAVPLGFIAGLALGFVTWIHLHGVVDPLVRDRVPEYVALAVVLEFAPLGAGLILAGRSGASIGAELGSMRLSEQIDALEVLGLSPLKQLVGPRVLAAMLTLPLLTILMAYIAIGSSFGAEMLGGSMSWTRYQSAVVKGLGSISTTKLVLSTLKTIVFGYLVAVTGCYFGMEATDGTEGVGRAATRSVVVSIFLVLIADVFLVKLIE